MTRQANLQATVLQSFRSRLRHEYLTSLREFYRTSGNNQSIKGGDVVLVRDDCPRSYCMVAVIESIIKGNDGCVRAANICTSAQLPSSTLSTSIVAWWCGMFRAGVLVEPGNPPLIAQDPINPGEPQHWEEFHNGQVHFPPPRGGCRRAMNSTL